MASEVSNSQTVAQNEYGEEVSSTDQCVLVVVLYSDLPNAMQW